MARFQFVPARERALKVKAIFFVSNEGSPRGLGREFLALVSLRIRDECAYFPRPDLIHQEQNSSACSGN